MFTFEVLYAYHNVTIMHFRNCKQTNVNIVEIYGQKGIFMQISMFATPCGLNITNAFSKSIVNGFRAINPMNKKMK